jgi:predicted MFS family arabinose efflux permease
VNDPAATGTLPKRPRSPLAVPAFRALWGASVISWIGGFVQDVGERWLMLDLVKGDPLPVAMLSTVFVGASLVTLLPAGALADRVSRRALVLVSQTAQAAVALGIALVTYTGHVSATVLLVAAGIAGVGTAIGQPAWSALVPELVDKDAVTEAIALNSAAYNVARALGPAVGGVVLSALGAPGSFAVNGATFGAVILVLLGYRAPRAERERARETSARPPAKRAFAEPLRLATREHGIRAAFVAMLAFSAGCAMVYPLTPAYAKSVLGVSAAQYGIMIGAMGVGAVAGATVLRRLRARLAPRALVALAMTAFATSSLALSQVRSLPLAALCFLPAGLGWIGSFSSLQALVQIQVPDAVRARILALYTMLHFVAWGSFATIGGVIATRWGVPTAFALGGGLCALAAATTTQLALPSSFSGPTAAHG